MSCAQGLYRSGESLSGGAGAAVHAHLSPSPITNSTRMRRINRHPSCSSSRPARLCLTGSRPGNPCPCAAMGQSPSGRICPDPAARQECAETRRTRTACSPIPRKGRTPDAARSQAATMSGRVATATASSQPTAIPSNLQPCHAYRLQCGSASWPRTRMRSRRCSAGFPPERSAAHRKCRACPDHAELRTETRGA